MNFKEKKKYLIKVFSYFLKYQKYDALISPLYYVLENLSPTISTVLLASFFDAVYSFMNGSYFFRNRVIIYGSLFVIFHLVKVFLQLIASIFTNAGVYERAMYNLNANIVKKSSEIPLIYYEHSQVMEKKAKAEECVRDDRIPSIFMLSTILFTSIVGVISLVVTLCTFSWILAFIAIISVLQFYISGYIQEQRIYELSDSLVKHKRKRDYLWSLFLDVKSIKEMRIMDFSNELAAKWIESRDQINDKMWDEELKNQKKTLICNFIKALGYIIGIVSALILLMTNNISIGAFGATLTAFLLVQNTIQNHLTSIGKIPVFLKYAQNYFDYIELPVNTIENDILCGEIETISFNNVFFKYPNAERMSLENISFTIRKGETIAIVGENGSGKTTLTKVLLGLFEPTKGDVKVNGTNIKMLDKDTLYKRIAFLSQEHFIYKLSIKENITLERSETVLDDDVIKVLEMVNLKKLCSDIHAEIGKEFNGIELSDGQKQRLAIARILLKDNEAVILDEPTSALDPLQENEILERFLELSNNKTTIIVSHRIGICTKVDRIMVMKNGNLVEFGSHDELIRKKGEYCQLYKAQSQWYL